MLIPNIIHFCYFGGKPLSIITYVAVKAALEINHPDKIYFYYAVEPEGEWWKKIKKLCEPVKIQPIEKIGDFTIVAQAHKADVWRLQKLLEVGGIYLDTDVICNKPFTPLMENSVVLGQEVVKGKVVGLCNAVILAKPGANFLRRWWDGYDPAKSLWQGFRAVGNDLYWSESSVKYPYFLSNYWAEEVEIVGFDSFYGFNWTKEQLKMFFETTQYIHDSYVYHLWSNSAYDLYLKDVTEESLNSVDTNFSRLMLRYL